MICEGQNYDWFHTIVHQPLEFVGLSDRLSWLSSVFRIEKWEIYVVEVAMILPSIAELLCKTFKINLSLLWSFFSCKTPINFRRWNDLTMVRVCAVWSLVQGCWWRLFCFNALMNDRIYTLSIHIHYCCYSFVWYFVGFKTFINWWKTTMERLATHLVILPEIREGLPNIGFVSGQLHN